MYTGLLHLHSTLRWVILILLVLMIIRAWAGRNGNRTWSEGDRKMGLFLLISSHIQLLIGTYQWISGPWGYAQIQMNGMADTMKNATARFFAVEHFIGMLVMITLVTIAYSYSKKSIDDKVKYNKLFWYYVIALALIMALVPWPFREVGMGRAWFPGM
ncbi:MAG: hypothetical protein ACKVTZ_11390 [Bacteroidia bacterium]